MRQLVLQIQLSFITEHPLRVEANVKCLITGWLSFVEGRSFRLSCNLFCMKVALFLTLLFYP